MPDIRIAGREILGQPRDITRPYGLFIQPKGFRGWQGISNTRRENLARAVEHGEHDTPVYLGSRVVTVDGWVLADNEYDLGHWSESLTGLLGAGRTQIVIDHQGNTRWAMGRVTEVDCEDRGIRSGILRAEFQLQFVFADPRKYGDENVWPETDTATSISVAHYGNFPAYPLIEIPSAASSYSITSPLGTYTVTGATAGGTHTVDLRRGRVFRNGVEMFDVGRGNLWTVAPGLPLLHTLSVPGRVRINDTYV